MIWSEIFGQIVKFIWNNKWKILIGLIIAILISISVIYYISNKNKAETIDKQKVELAMQQDTINQLTEEIKAKNTELLAINESIKIAKETMEKNKIIIEQAQTKIDEYKVMAEAIAKEQDEKKKKQATADYLNKVFGIKSFTSKLIL
jgi:peptidoglycan hydrolase CwlO-like protein